MNLAVDEDGFKLVKPRWVRKSKEILKKTDDQQNTINPGTVEQQNYVDVAPCEQSKTTLYSYVDNTTTQQGQENMKAPIGIVCNTLNIRNGFELL